MASSEPTIVYTDGACLGNPGPGGWAWAIPRGAYASGPEPRTTNQRMEIKAVLEALRAVDPPGGVTVFSDSTYVVNCFRDRWWEAWLRRGWINSARKPVANRDLWEPLVELVRARRNVTFRWVKGHSGDVMNDFVDELAVHAARTQKGQSGNMATEAARATARGVTPVRRTSKPGASGRSGRSSSSDRSTRSTRSTRP